MEARSSTPLAGAKAYDPADGAAVREALHQEQRDRCTSNLRGCNAAYDSVCTDQKHRTADSPLTPSRAPGFIKARTAQANQICGLLVEHGLVVPQGIAYIALRVPVLIEDATNDLPGTFRRLIDRLLEHLKLLDRQVNEVEAQIRPGIVTTKSADDSTRCRESDRSQRARWLQWSAMERTSTTAGNSRRGWGLCPDNITPAARQSCLA